MHTQTFFPWFATWTAGRTSLNFGNWLLVAWKSSLPVGVSLSAGTSAASADGSCPSRSKSLSRTDWKEAGRGCLRGDKQISQGWASSLAGPQEMSSSCFSFFNLPPLPLHSPVGPPIPPSSGLPPSHTRFRVENITVKREESRDWKAEKQRGMSPLLEACSLDLSALVWGKVRGCSKHSQTHFLGPVSALTALWPPALHPTLMTRPHL